MADVYFISGGQESNRGGFVAVLLPEDKAKLKKKLLEKMLEIRKLLVDLSVQPAKYGDYLKMQRELDELEVRYKAITSAMIVTSKHAKDAKVGDVYPVDKFRKKFQN